MAVGNVDNRWFIQYVCTENPDHTWISIVGYSGMKRRNEMICRKDDAPANVVICRPLKESDIPDDRRLWGEFICDCGNDWSSANAWKGYIQDCTECGAAVEPQTLRLLRYGQSLDNDKRHLSEKCEKCRELGFNCRKYKK